MTIEEEKFIDFYNSRHFDANCFNPDGTLNKNYNSCKVTGTIAEILEDHWDVYYEANKEIIDKHRPNADKEIHKVIDCHNKDLGCSVYECPKCHDLVFIGHTCKSRFCSSCGYKYKNERVASILSTACNCNHRQIVFTIPEELRSYFFDFGDMIDILFQAVNETIYSIFNDTFKKNKKGVMKKYSSRTKYYPGFFAFLHTFGRDLKWNPHIHILIAECKIDANGFYKKVTYFNYEALSKRFQKILLDLMSKKLGKSFDEMESKMYANHQKGFYVYAEPKKFKSFKAGVEYVARYCGRTPISENRIVKYDGENVTFSYTDHKDNQYHEKTVTAFEFISMLLRHLLPHELKIIRYYGFYRRKNKFKLVPMIKEEAMKVRRELTKYSQSLRFNFGRDPYNCPKCGTRLLYSVFLN